MVSRFFLACFLAGLLSAKFRVRTGVEYAILTVGCFVFLDAVLTLMLGYAAFAMLKR